MAGIEISAAPDIWIIPGQTNSLTEALLQTPRQLNVMLSVVSTLCRANLIAFTLLRTSMVVIRCPSCSIKSAANCLAAKSQFIHSLLTPHKFGYFINNLLKSPFRMLVIII
uniref:Uncharacterized protein n=1 Tax=Glossina austeni TaxID=7395 RepID=A0A1A9VU16_GLOAU